MGAEFLHLLANAALHVREGVEVVRRKHGGPADALQLVAKFVVSESEHATVGVVDEDELLGAELVMGDDERAQRVFGDDAAGIADDMGVADIQAEGADGEPRIHAGEDGELAFGTRREVFELVRAGVGLIGDEDIVGDGHSSSGNDDNKRRRLGILCLRQFGSALSLYVAR